MDHYDRPAGMRHSLRRPCCHLGLAAIWGAPFIYPDEIAKTSAVICTLLGALLGISTAQYNKDNYTYSDEEYIYPDEVDDEDE